MTAKKNLFIFERATAYSLKNARILRVFHILIKAIDNSTVEALWSRSA